MVTNVNLFIQCFHDISEDDDITDVFTCGCCYWFAHILKTRYPQGEIMYDPVINHFVTQIDGRLYDITGDVTGLYDVVSWENYEDDLEKERIINNCIKFIF